MDEIEKMIEGQKNANNLFEKLKELENISDVDDILVSMDEKIAKLVLKKFIIENYTKQNEKTLDKVLTDSSNPIDLIDFIVKLICASIIILIFANLLTCII